VPGLRKLTASRSASWSPTPWVAGLHSPRTGIVDYVAVARTYAQMSSKAAARFSWGAKVDRHRAAARRAGAQDERQRGSHSTVVNCAGLAVT